MNEVKKLMVHVQNIDEVAFFRKDEQLIEIMRVLHFLGRMSD